ncbi:PLAC8 family-domain-containing protein, partial [Cantharellus anzutake]|uniref:PLAC8 family-domain-containing protein n=1 Tax=Cantharellus anzutake TaxID=1750568 RepID=UPI0019050495
QQQYIAQQPRAAPQMVYGAGGNRNALDKPFDAAGQRKWSFGPCDCTEVCGTWVLSYFCPCLSYGRNMSRLKHMQTHGRPHPAGGEMFNEDCLLYELLGYAHLDCLAGMNGRASIRRRYSIQGGEWEDCMCHTLCRSCSLTQESRELGLEEESQL